MRIAAGPAEQTRKPLGQHKSVSRQQKTTNGHEQTQRGLRRKVIHRRLRGEIPKPILAADE
jgi:hypothetical protein